MALVGPKSVGSWRYSIDPSTSPICLSYAFGFNEDPRIWIEGQQPPVHLMNAIEDGAIIHGWNSMSFEYAIFENVMGPRYGWAKPKVEQYRDTMLDALTLGFPAALAKAAPAIGVEDLKDKEGKRLINFLCKPIASGKRKGEFRMPDEFHKEYVSMYQYCKQDVRTERSIHKALPRHLEGKELARAHYILKINRRGLPIDVPAAQAIAEAIKVDTDAQCERFYDITGLDSPRQVEKYIGWLESNGCAMSNLQADTVTNMLGTPVLKPYVRESLVIRQQVTKTSNAKYNKILGMLCPDNTVKDNLIFNKAATGRLAGSGFQAQNQPRASVIEPETFIQMFCDRDLDTIRMFYPITMAATGLIRSMIKAPTGKKFLSGDLKGIEARMTSWVAQEWDILENYKKGIDSYVSSASEMYHVPIAKVTKAQRQLGKVAVLLGGFGGGYRAIIRGGVNHGLEFSAKEAKVIINDLRRGRPKLVKTWDNFGKAAMYAVLNPGFKTPTDRTKRFHFLCEGSYLYMILPSGRYLSFPFPELREEFFFGKLQTNVTAMWVDSYTNKWSRRSITGANFFQSAVQASARDVLFHSHDIAEDQDFPLVLSVHDEGLSMVDDEPCFNIQQYDKMMTDNPTWCQDLPLESDCWEGHRYKKG